MGKYNFYVNTTPERPFLGGELLYGVGFFGTLYGTGQSEVIGQLAGGFAFAFTKSSFTESRS